MKLQVLPIEAPDTLPTVKVVATNPRILASPKGTITNPRGWEPTSLAALLGEANHARYTSGTATVFTVSESRYKLVARLRAPKNHDELVLLFTHNL